MNLDEVTQARAVIRGAHTRLTARIAGVERTPDGQPDRVVVMVDADEGVGQLTADPGTRQQLDDIMRLGRAENIIVCVTERKP